MKFHEGIMFVDFHKKQHKFSDETKTLPADEKGSLVFELLPFFSKAALGKGKNTMELLHLVLSKL